jgi:hypothetical protein
VVELAIALILTQLGDWCDQVPEFIRSFCCRGCRDRVESALKKELDKGRADAAERLSAIEGTDGRFANLIETLLDSGCAKVAAALSHVVDPEKLRTSTDGKDSQDQPRRLESDGCASRGTAARARAARRSEDRKPRATAATEPAIEADR